MLNFIKYQNQKINQQIIYNNKKQQFCLFIIFINQTKSTIKGETPHQCEVCGKKYTRKEHLANHMRSHTNDTPFRCEICGKSFSRKEHFTNHILWHTGMYHHK